MSASTMYVTPAGAGVKDGTTWAKAFGEAEFEADLEANAEAGDIYYIMEGTYTLDSAYDSSARDGTAIAPISIIGVKAETTAEPPTISDWAYGTDRPLFAAAANTTTFGDYYRIYNIQVTCTNSFGILPGACSILYNCKSTNSGAATRSAISGGSAGILISCEGISTNGNALNTGVYMAFCYAHDSVTGIVPSANGNYLFNIIDTCTTGIAVASIDSIRGFGNTIYNSTTAVSATDSLYNVWINNIIDTATDGFLWTTQTNVNMFAYNHKGNNVTDMWDLVEESVAPHKDMWVTSGDPKFTNAVGGIFSLASDSPCIDAGMAMLLGVG